MDVPYCPCSTRLWNGLPGNTRWRKSTEWNGGWWRRFPVKPSAKPWPTLWSIVPGIFPLLYGWPCIRTRWKSPRREDCRQASARKNISIIRFPFCGIPNWQCVLSAGGILKPWNGHPADPLATYHQSRIKPDFQVTDHIIQVTLPLVDAMPPLDQEEQRICAVFPENGLLSRQEIEQATGFGKDQSHPSAEPAGGEKGRAESGQRPGYPLPAAVIPKGGKFCSVYSTHRCSRMESCFCSFPSCVRSFVCFSLQCTIPIGA